MSLLVVDEAGKIQVPSRLSNPGGTSHGPLDVGRQMRLAAKSEAALLGWTGRAQDGSLELRDGTGTPAPVRH